MPFNISNEKLIRDSKNIEFDARFESDSISYFEFLDFFKNRKVISMNDFVISAYFSYGWMPTILNLGHANKNDLKECVDLVNKVKLEKILSFNELETLKKVVNNSIVGVSKLLHFINPSYYVIWDSRVANYFSMKNINYTKSYMGYLEYCHSIPPSILKEIHNNISGVETSFKKTTKLRALEFLFFSLGKSKR